MDYPDYENLPCLDRNKNNRMFTEQKIIFHLFDDPTFMYLVQNYHHPDLKNEILYIGEPSEKVKRYTDKIFPSSKRGVRKIIRYCDSADLIVIYNLNFPKTYLVNRLPSGKRILWRFYGSELYRYLSEVTHSPSTRLVLSSFKEGWKFRIRKKWGKINLGLKWHTLGQKEFKKAVRRCDYFLGVCELEHDFLLNQGLNLPPFIQVPYTHIIPEQSYQISEKDPLVIVGHSRSPYVNHLDILTELKSVGEQETKYLLFFSYGEENHYTRKVREEAVKIPQMQLIDQFLPKTEFEGIYRRAAALALDTYRQMAVGNIITAFNFGVKVYLNPKNVLYHFYRNEGFLVFNTNSLPVDIQNKDIHLSSVEMEHNIGKVKELAKKFSQEKFLEKLSLDALGVLSQ